MRSFGSKLKQTKQKGKNRKIKAAQRNQSSRLGFAKKAMQ
jgi:hypothetical protein